MRESGLQATPLRDGLERGWRPGKGLFGQLLSGKSLVAVCDSARTTSLQRCVWRTRVSHVWHPGLLLRHGLLCCGVHWPQVKGDTKVVSMASWTPPQRGSPLAMTSILWSFCRWRQFFSFGPLSLCLQVTYIFRE